MTQKNTTSLWEIEIPYNKIVVQDSELSQENILFSETMLKYKKRIRVLNSNLSLNYVGIECNCSNPSDKIVRFRIFALAHQVQQFVEAASEIFDTDNIALVHIGDKYDWITERNKRQDAKIYYVTLWDASDRVWTTQDDKLTLAEAKDKLNYYTNNGTRNVQYSDGDYFTICKR